MCEAFPGLTESKHNSVKFAFEFKLFLSTCLPLSALLQETGVTTLLNFLVQ